MVFLGMSILNLTKQLISTTVIHNNKNIKDLKGFTIEMIKKEKKIMILN